MGLVKSVFQYSAHSRIPKKHYFNLLFWRGDDGRKIPLEIPDLAGDEVQPFNQIPIELNYELGGRYAIYRFIYEMFDESRGYELTWTVWPIHYLCAAHVIDIQRLQTISGDKDIAFNSDRTWFVTERDGLPTLVNMTTLENVQRFKVQKPMTAATFSPDDKLLYIATEKNQIEVFDVNTRPSFNPQWSIYK